MPKIGDLVGGAGAVVATIAAVLGVLFLATKVLAKPKDFVLSIVWGSEMPFEVGSVQNFTVYMENITDEPHYYHAELYWIWGLTASGGGYALPEGKAGFGGSLGMPSEPGTYDLTAKVYVDDMLKGSYTLSKVRVT